MKKLLFTLFIAIICLSCRQTEYIYNTNEQADFYYVRFEAYNKSSSSSAMSVNISLSGCKRIQRDGKASSITEVLGPAQKNALAYISASGAELVRIYVSKNNGPFALQAEGTTITSCMLDF